MNSSLFVEKRNGQKELFDIQKIKTTASWSTNNIDGVDPLELERHIHLSLKDGMLTTKIMNEMIQSALSLVSLEEPNWSLVAGRLALMDLNKSVRYNVANFKNKNVKKKFGYSKFSDYLNWAIESKVYKDIKSSYTQDQIDQIDNFMGKISQEERDLNYHYCTIASMQTQYLQKKESKLVELPQEMYMAISMTLAPHVSKTDDEKLQNVFDFFKVMSEQYVSPGTPTVRNIRTEGGSGMSCAVDAFGDSLDQIDHTIEKVQKESTKGTGWGAYIGKLRAKGSWIQKHKDMAGGTVPFLKQLDSAIIAVDQLGAREANIAVYQDCWHLDILDFLELKTENGDINRKAYNLFLAVCFNDEFFRRRDAKEEWTLIDPYEARQILGKDLCDFFGEEWTAAYSKLESSDLQLFKKINAMDLWKAFIKAFSETGDPFTFNRDEVNRLNPNPDYPIYGSNLCSEITSPFIEDGVSVVTSENMEGQIFEVVKRAVGYTTTCNLASINMSKLSKEDPKLTEFVARTAIKLIDAVITENNVASLSAKRFNKDFRSAGIGYIGVHNFLALNKLKYGSKEAIDLLDSMLNKITYFVISESCSLAKNFGPYPKFRTSKMAQGIFFGRNYQENGWDEEFYQNIKTYGLRNGYMFAIAPNTSTSLLINETPSIYPVTDKLVLKEGKSGSYLVPMPNLDSNFAYYIPAHAMDYKSYLDTVATFQKWTDQSISTQIYFDPNNPEHDALYLHNMFRYALNDLHLKTTYYSRQKPSSCFGCAN